MKINFEILSNNIHKFLSRLFKYELMAMVLTLMFTTQMPFQWYTVREIFTHAATYFTSSALYVFILVLGVSVFYLFSNTVTPAPTNLDPITAKVMEILCKFLKMELFALFVFFVYDTNFSIPDFVWLVADSPIGWFMHWTEEFLCGEAYRSCHWFIFFILLVFDIIPELFKFPAHECKSIAIK